MTYVTSEEGIDFVEVQLLPPQMRKLKSWKNSINLDKMNLMQFILSQEEKNDGR